jgi:hypothetical protein
MQNKGSSPAISQSAGEEKGYTRLSWGSKKGGKLIEHLIIGIAVSFNCHCYAQGL